MRFTTLSPECRNIELVKDVGQIPYVLGKEHSNIETEIVESCVKSDGENLDSVKGLKLTHRKLLFNSTELTGLIYLLFNSKKIDWLSLHHAGRRSYYWTKLYKFLNSKGKAYLKLDLDFRSCDMYDKDEWERKIFEKNMQIMDLVTVETDAVKNRIQKYSCQEIEVLGNGYCKTEFDVDIYQKRENSFITVGRLGSKQKATEILLEAFAKSSNQHDWNLKLVGTIEEEFKPVITEFYLKYPNLKSRVIFTGEIKDRQELYEEYCKAKVFVLPSRWEGFAIVGGEALSCGCQLIVSDQVPPAKEMTKNGEYGRIAPVDDIDQLCQALIKATKMPTNDKKIEEIKEYADTQFSWSKICDSLYSMLKSR